MLVCIAAGEPGNNTHCRSVAWDTLTRPRLLLWLQEDAHAVVLDLDPAAKCGFFAVFDGHGGKEVAKFCALYMVRWAASPIKHLCPNA